MLLEDVEYFLEKTKAKECFDMLDLDRDGKISLQVTPYCMLSYCLFCFYLHPTLSLQIGPGQRDKPPGRPVLHAAL